MVDVARNAGRRPDAEPSPRARGRETLSTLKPSGRRSAKLGEGNPPDPDQAGGKPVSCFGCRWHVSGRHLSLRSGAGCIGSAGRRLLGVEVTGCRARRRRRVGQSVEQPVDRVLVALDGGAFLVGERDLDEHPLQPVLGLEQLRLAGWLGDVEVAAGARHPVRALLEEAVGAVAVPEVVELERLRRCRPAPLVIASRSRSDLDRADVAREVAGVGVGLGQGDRGDPRVVLGGLR